MPFTTVHTTTTSNAAVHTNTSFVLLVSIAASLGGLLFGFDTAIISGTIPFIQPYFGLTDVTLGWAVSSILIGCGAGAALAGKLSDHFGRKPVLLVAAVLFAATGVGTAMAESFPVFIFFRITGGLAVGSAALVAPMYIAETVPAARRGRLVTLYQMAIVTGILLAYLCNYLLAGRGEDSWRWMFGSQAAPAMLFLAAMLLAPETPRWLVQKGKEAKALRLLAKIGGDTFAREALPAIRQSFSAETGAGIRILFRSRYQSVVWLGCLMAFFQQVTGINAILYYAPVILQQTGIGLSGALLQTIGIGLVMAVFTLLAAGFIDRAGRRPLLLAGSLLMAFALTGVAACLYWQVLRYYLVFIFLLVYIAAFSMSLGAVTWVLLSEIFPNQIRGLALSLSTLVLWLSDFIASFFFPVLNERIGGAGTLLLFATLCFTCFFHVRKKVPETRGKSLEQVEALFAPSSKTIKEPI